MKSTDLRRGNIIFWDHKGKPDNDYLCTHVVDSIELNGIWTQAGFCKIENIKPIAINEKHLIYSGFKKLNHLGRFIYVLYIDEWLNFEVDLNLKTFHLVSGQENNDLNINVGYYIIYRLMDIKFIHELQNIYYLFTKKELDI